MYIHVFLATHNKLASFQQKTLPPGSRVVRPRGCRLEISYVSHAERPYSRTCEPSVRERTKRSNRERAALCHCHPSSPAHGNGMHACFPHHQPVERFHGDDDTVARARRRVPGKRILRVRARPWRDARLHAAVSRPAALCWQSSLQPAPGGHVALLPCSHTCGLSPAER